MPRCPTCYRRLAGGATCPQDGSTAPPSSLDAQERGAPPSVPGYAVGEYLGAGGFATVWAGERHGDGSAVAIKVVHDVSELARTRLAREAEALRAVGPPHVPRYCDTGSLADGRLYLVMERLHGPTLADALQAMAAPAEHEWVQRVSDRLLAALDAMHGSQVVHRDLKPDNVILVGESPLDVRLVDFGLIKAIAPAAGENLTRHGELLGTTEYMAPEQLRSGADIDQRTDLYAFGVLLYELLTLRVPFVGDRASIEHGHLALRPPKLRQHAQVPESVERLLMACLAKNPDKRPSDAGTLRNELARAWGDAAPDLAPARRESTLSLLVDRRQPVVLAAIDADAAPAELSALIKQYGGFVARQRGHRYVCAFSGSMVDDPFESALAAVHEIMEEHEARAALHLARLAIRRKRRGPPAIIGRAVDQPDTWLPQDEWSGVVFTASLADSQPADILHSAPALEGFFALAERTSSPQSEISLVGRDHVLERASHSLEACIDSATPGLLTIIGDTGLGKTRLAHELATLAHRRCPEARVVSVRANKIGTRTSNDAAQQIRAELRGRGLALGMHIGHAESHTPLVVILDDAHWADSETLDWIEYATLDHEHEPLWIVVLAHPHLEAMRSHWGSRAHRHDRVALAQLDMDAAMALAAQLLLPAEYPPAEFLKRLARWARGNPQLLTGLVAELKRRGVVRRRQHGQGWDVATAELEQLPAAPAGQWLATRMLDTMPPELAACVRVCSVLGSSFTGDELAWVQDAMERYGGAGTPVDAEVGLDLLVSQGIFERAGANEFAFTTPALQGAVYKLLGAVDRDKIHRYATEYWESRLSTHAHARGDEVPDVMNSAAAVALEHFARHAGTCGRVDEAIAVLVRLGDAARSAHNYVEADNRYTAALRLGGNDMYLRARAHAGRGKVRYHIHRIQEAFEDICAARELSEELGDTAAVVELWLEEATAADVAADWTRSARCAELAQTHLDSLADSARKTALATRCLMATGRSLWREGRAEPAIEQLSQAAHQADAAEDYETAVIAELLLGCALVHEGRSHQAEDVFESVIGRCTRAHDRLHECRAYANRIYLWRKQPNRAIDDLRKAVQLARNVGNPEPERTATHNLAELLYWNGDYDEALALARRSRVLQKRFWQQVPQDALLLARIHAVRDELDSSRELIEWLGRECEPDKFDPSVHILYRMIQLVLAEKYCSQTVHSTEQQWNVLIDSGKAELPSEELIEVLWWRAHTAIQSHRWQPASIALAEARSRLTEAPIWSRRVETLELSLP